MKPITTKEIVGHLRDWQQVLRDSYWEWTGKKRVLRDRKVLREIEALEQAIKIIRKAK